MGADSNDILRAAHTSALVTLAPAPLPAILDSWVLHPSDPLRFVKLEIWQLVLRRDAPSIAQIPEEYLKCYHRPLTHAIEIGESLRIPDEEAEKGFFVCVFKSGDVRLFPGENAGVMNLQPI